MHVTVEDVPQVRVRNTGILIRIREEGGEGGGAPKSNAKSLSMNKFVEFLNTLK